MGVLNAKVGTEWVPISAGQFNVEHWNSGWGIVASGSLLTPSPLSLPLNATTQVTNSLPFTTQAGRRYRVVVEARAIRSTTTAQTYASIGLRDGTTALYPQSAIHWVSSTAAPTVYNTLYYEWVLAGDGVARSYNVALTSVTVTSELYTDYLGYFYIEDVGPINRLAAGATPPASDWTAYDARYVATPTPWTALAFGTNWSNYGSGYTNGQYRKVGDEVQVRGLVGCTAVNTTIATLPVGYRPPLHAMFVAWMSCNGSAVRVATRVEVMTTGVIQLNALSLPTGTTNAAVTIYSHLQLDGISFSVAA